VKTPLTVATGVDPDAMAATLVWLQWDLPSAVSVHEDGLELWLGPIRRVA
jgi:hypothetical protein